MLVTTVVVLEERKVGMKLLEKRNVKRKQVVNVKKKGASVKESARKKWQVEEVVQKVIDSSPNVQEKGLLRKTEHFGKVQLKLQKERCLYRRKLYRRAILIAIQEALKLPAGVKAVTKVADEVLDEFYLTQKDPVHRDLGLVPDRNLEAVLEVVHDRDHNRDHDHDHDHHHDHDHDQDFNPDPHLVHGLDLVQVPSRGVNRGRKVRRDQDPFQRKVVHARDPDQGQGRVNRDQDRVVVRGKVDRNQDQGRVLQLVHDQDRVLQLAHDQDQALHVRDRDLQLVHDRDQGLLVVPEKQLRDQGQGQDQDQGVVHSRRDVYREVEADQNLNLCQDLDRVLVHGQRVVLEVAALVDRQDLLLQSRENQFRAVTLVPAIRVQIEEVAVKANKLNTHIITSLACGKSYLILDYVVFVRTKFI